MYKQNDSQNRSFFSFGNPFRGISPKGLSPNSKLSPDLIDMLHLFEETIEERLRSLIPKIKSEVTSFTWVKSATEAVCAIQGDIRNLIIKLELPINNWDEKWVELYLDTTVKLLDLCIAFTSEIMRINQSNLFLQCASQTLESDASNKFGRARSSLATWSQMVAGKNPRMENCSKIMKSLSETLDSPKGKISGKGKVLMSGMYGVRAVTVYLCSVFASILSGDRSNMMEVKVSESFAWGAGFNELVSTVNGMLREVMEDKKVAILNEVNDVDTRVKCLQKVVDGGQLKNEVKELKDGVETLGHVLEVLEKEVDALFKVVLDGRDALLSSLRSATLSADANFVPFMKPQKVM